MKGSILYQRQYLLLDKLIKLEKRTRLLEIQACFTENMSNSASILADLMKDILLSHHVILIEKNSQNSSKRKHKDPYMVAILPFTYKKTNTE